MGDHPAGCSAGEAGPPAAKAPKQPRSPTPRDPQAEEISLLILRQKSARAAIRLETFLPPQLKPTRIPDPLDRQEVPASPGWGGGRGGVPPRTAGPSPSSPAAEAGGDHPGGESRRQHLPALTATPIGARPRRTGYIKVSPSKHRLSSLGPPGRGGGGRAEGRGGPHAASPTSDVTVNSVDSTAPATRWESASWRRSHEQGRGASNPSDPVLPPHGLPSLGVTGGRAWLRISRTPQK